MDFGKLCTLRFFTLCKNWHFSKGEEIFTSCHISQKVWAKTVYTLRTRSVAMVMGTSRFSSHIAIVALKVRYCYWTPFTRDKNIGTARQIFFRACKWVLYLIHITAGPAEESVSFGNQFEESFSVFFSLNLILSSLLKIPALQVGKSVHSNVLIIDCSFQNYGELPGYGYSCWLLIYCERAAIGNLKLFKVTTKYPYGFDFTIHLCDHNSATVANI